MALHSLRVTLRTEAIRVGLRIAFMRAVFLRRLIRLVVQPATETRRWQPFDYLVLIVVNASWHSLRQLQHLYAVFKNIDTRS